MNAQDSSDARGVLGSARGVLGSAGVTRRGIAIASAVSLALSSSLAVLAPDQFASAQQEIRVSENEHGGNVSTGVTGGKLYLNAQPARSRSGSRITIELDPGLDDQVPT